jgi:hypothetical protein
MSSISLDWITAFICFPEIARRLRYQIDAKRRPRQSFPGVLDDRAAVVNRSRGESDRRRDYDVLYVGEFVLKLPWTIVFVLSQQKHGKVSCAGSILSW